MDGRRVVGAVSLAAGADAFQVRTAGRTSSVKVADVLAVVLRPMPPFRPPDPGVVLQTGDRLTGRIGVMTGNRIEVETALFGTIRFTVDQLAALHFTSPPDARRRRIMPPGALLADGSFVAGPLRWLTPETMALESEVMGLAEVPRRRVRSYAVAPVERGGGRDPRVEVRCINGDLVSGTLVSLGPAGPVIEAPWIGRRTVPNDRVQRLRFLGGPVVPLTDLEPAEKKTVPFFDAIRPPVRGRSLDARPLRIGDRRYVTGWGVEPRTELTFRLDGTYRWFHVDVGIDEEVGDHGNVAFRIELDGRVAYRSGPVTGAMQAQPVHLNVARAKVMRLIVDFGADAHLLDHADWAEPILIAAR